MGSPTTDQAYSPRRTVATLQQPLMALFEVAYADVLLPLLDTMEVLKAEWQVVDEKLYGLSAQIVTHAPHYQICRPQLKRILLVVLSIYETMAQCQVEQSVTWHLTHPEYPKAVRRDLKVEITRKICELHWQLSMEVLAMQLAVQAHTCSCDALVEWQPPPGKVESPSLEQKEPEPEPPPAAAPEPTVPPAPAPAAAPAAVTPFVRKELVQRPRRRVSPRTENPRFVFLATGGTGKRTPLSSPRKTAFNDATSVPVRFPSHGTRKMYRTPAHRLAPDLLKPSLQLQGLDTSSGAPPAPMVWGEAPPKPDPSRGGGRRRPGGPAAAPARAGGGGPPAAAGAPSLLGEYECSPVSYRVPCVRLRAQHAVGRHHRAR